MHLHRLKPPPGASRRPKRVGRGNASGHGTYSGRGSKGQKARPGHKPRLGFEGGQLPFIRRMARKRGFVNIFRVEYTPVNLDKLERFDSASPVTVAALVAAGIVKDTSKPVKVLGDGEVAKPLVVQVHKFSRAARAKIEAAGGRAEEVPA
ncbi:MAG: 50S ribosomal protein L15 [Dehalococcoidia bacterium]